MNAPKWWLRWKLRYAARLLNKGVLNHWQYSDLAIKLGYGVLKEPLTNDVRIEQFPFLVALSNALGLPQHHSETEYRHFLKTYGPLNEVITIALPDVSQPFTEATPPDAFNWNSDHDNRAKSASLLLNPFNRLAFRIQEWWNEQERLFPLFTKMTAFIAGLIVGAVVGWFARGH